MKIAAVAVLSLLAVLCPCLRVQASSSLDIIRQAAANWTDPLPCGGWNCDCAFSKAKGCCCVTTSLFQLEEQTFMRMVALWKNLDSVSKQIEEVTAGKRNVAFVATMTPITGCFGPFTNNVPLAYGNVTLNHGYGYNPALGTFTAPRSGLYSFSYTVYSNGTEKERVYHKVQLMKDGQVIASSWEDNREDFEDSATQSVVLQLNQGDQVHVELGLGRYLCSDIEGYNSFSGYLIYPF